VINSGKLYGAARRAAPARVFLSRDEKDRRVRNRVRLLYENELPKLLQSLEDTTYPTAQPLLTQLAEIRQIFGRFAAGEEIDPDGLAQSFHQFELACERQGSSPWRPDTIVGAVNRCLRNEVMALVDYIVSR